MQPRRATFLPATEASGHSAGAKDREALGSAERRVIALVRPERSAESAVRPQEPVDARAADQRRFDAFIDGLCEVFVLGGIAEVRRLALAAATPAYASALACAPGPGARALRPALAASRRRSEIDMFTSILSALETARRRGGADEALAEFARIGRRIGPLALRSPPRRGLLPGVR